MIDETTYKEIMLSDGIVERDRKIKKFSFNT